MGPDVRRTLLGSLLDSLIEGGPTLRRKVVIDLSTLLAPSTLRDPDCHLLAREREQVVEFFLKVANAEASANRWGDTELIEAINEVFGAALEASLTREQLRAFLAELRRHV